MNPGQVERFLLRFAEQGSKNRAASQQVRTALELHSEDLFLVIHRHRQQIEHSTPPVPDPLVALYTDLFFGLSMSPYLTYDDIGQLTFYTYLHARISPLIRPVPTPTIRLDNIRDRFFLYSNLGLPLGEVVGGRTSLVRRPIPVSDHSPPDPNARLLRIEVITGDQAVTEWVTDQSKSIGPELLDRFQQVRIGLLLEENY